MFAKQFEQPAQDAIHWLNSGSNAIDGVAGEIKFTMKRFIEVNATNPKRTRISCCVAGLIEIMRRKATGEPIIDMDMIDLWNIFDLKNDESMTALAYVNLPLREKIRYNSITRAEAAQALLKFLGNSDGIWDHLPGDIYKGTAEDEP